MKYFVVLINYLSSFSLTFISQIPLILITDIKKITFGTLGGKYKLCQEPSIFSAFPSSVILFPFSHKVSTLSALIAHLR